MYRNELLGGIQSCRRRRAKAGNGRGCSTGLCLKYIKCSTGLCLYKVLNWIMFKVNIYKMLKCPTLLFDPVPGRRQLGRCRDARAHGGRGSIFQKPFLISTIPNKSYSICVHTRCMCILICCMSCVANGLPTSMRAAPPQIIAAILLSFRDALPTCKEMNANGSGLTE